jgi:hypothetical protein
MAEMIVTYKGQTYRVHTEEEIYALVLALLALERLAALRLSDTRFYPPVGFRLWVSATLPVSALVTSLHTSNHHAPVPIVYQVDDTPITDPDAICMLCEFFDTERSRVFREIPDLLIHATKICGF